MNKQREKSEKEGEKKPNIPPEERKFNHKVMSPKSPISRAVNNKMVFQKEHSFSHERTQLRKNEGERQKKESHGKNMGQKEEKK